MKINTLLKSSLSILLISASLFIQGKNIHYAAKTQDSLSVNQATLTLSSDTSEITFSTLGFGGLDDPYIPADPINPEDTVGANNPITEDPKPEKEFVYNGSPLNPDMSTTSTLPVGSINGSFDVSPTGAALYTINFDIPKGVGGMQPSIGISYNSQAGMGNVGWGCNITGISVITRRMKDILHDGKVQGITHLYDDAYYLDGKRLILVSGDNGHVSAVYHPEGDPFTTVSIEGTDFSPWFKIVTRDGMVYEYGNGEKCRQQYNKAGQSRINAWYINHSQDRLGNEIVYHYMMSELSVYPSVIEYGMNQNKSTVLRNTIEFSYASIGAAAAPFIIDGVSGEMNKRLSSVTCKSNSEVYRTYELCYDTTSDKSGIKYPRLIQIDEKNSFGEAQKPLKISWSYLSSSKINSSILDVQTSDNSAYFNYIKEEFSKSFFAVDVNNDGISDIFRFSSVQKWDGEMKSILYVSLSQKDKNGKVSYKNPNGYEFEPNISEDRVRLTLGGGMAMDYDGDGYNDITLLMFYKKGELCSCMLYILRGKKLAEGYPEFKYIDFPLITTEEAPLYMLLDINGDGKDDAIYVEKNANKNVYNGGIVLALGEKKNHTPLELKFDHNPQKLFTGDYNNDGLPDLIFLYDGGYKIYFNSGENAVTEKFTESNQITGTGLGNYWRVQQGDFDGDGLPDFLYIVHGDPHLWIAHNNGNGTFSCFQSADIGVINHDSKKDDYRFAIMVSDFDHDGRSDVMVSKANYKYRGGLKQKNEYRDTSVKWLHSTGSTLELVNSYTKHSPSDADEKYIFLGDFDGDGYPELANYGNPLNSDNDNSEIKINVYNCVNDKFQEGKVTSITDGFDNNIHILYSNITNSLIYKHTQENNYPINIYTLPLSVVRTVTKSNGSAGIMNFRYSYEDLKVHIAGGGILGFAGIIQENLTLGSKETTNTKWDSKWRIPKEIKVTNTIGPYTSEILSSFAIENKEDIHNYFSYISQKKVTDFDGNTIVTESHYDTSKGVVTDETVRNSEGMYKKVNYKYLQGKTGWLPAVLTMRQKHEDDATPFETITDYNYDDKDNILSIIENKKSPFPLTTAYTYDIFGNVLTKETTGSGISPVREYHEYDETGRFITKTYTSPSSAVKTYTYDQWGHVLTENDETVSSGILTTTYTYDGWGNLVSAQSPEGAVTRYYQGWGDTPDKRYYTIKKPEGAPWTKTWYDAAGREVQTESVGTYNIPLSSQTFYDNRGNVSKKTQQTGKRLITEEFSYDDRGRVVSSTSNTGKTVTHEYGNRSETVTEDGRVYTKTYDAWGNVVSSSDPAGTVEYTYASCGKPVEVRAGGAVTTMTYDNVGNQLTLSDPDAGTTTYTYNAMGDVISQTDARGITTKNTYDELNRLTKTSVDGVNTIYTYGTSGNNALRLIKKQTGDNSISYDYDNYGRVTTETRRIGTEELAFKYAYNDFGQLTQAVYPGNVTVSYEYEESGNRRSCYIDTVKIWGLDYYDGLRHAVTHGGRRTYWGDILGWQDDLLKKEVVSEQIRDEYGFPTENRLMLKGRNLGGIPTNSLLSVGGIGGIGGGGSGGIDLGDIDPGKPLPDFPGFNKDILRHDSLSFSFDRQRGNLLSRTGMIPQKETFGYDEADRLTTVSHDGTVVMEMEYADNGNILSKTGIGNYWYEQGKPHAVTSVDNEERQIASEAQTTEYNGFGKIQQITDESTNCRMDFSYGPDQERWKTVLTQNGNTIRTTLYAGDYERITADGVTRHFYYLENGAIYVRTEEEGGKAYFALTDHLGSIVKMVDEDYNTVFEASYDVWGRQTVTTNTIGFHRGYTGHEMLPEFGLINMNGRLYDPVIGRFLSPDNYVQAPDFTQSFNRYSYCLNNPLKYNDPSGEVIGIDDVIAMAVFSAATSMMQAGFNDENVWKAGAISLLSSAASYGIGSLFGATGNFGQELLRAGAHGLSSGLISILNGENFGRSFISGAAASGIGSFAQGVHINSELMIASTTLTGGAVAWATGGDFLQGAMQGLYIGALNHAVHSGPERCERLADGFYASPYDVDEVRVTANRIYPFKSTVPAEKPLIGIYPEFKLLFLGRALLNGGVFTAWYGAKAAYQFYQRFNRTIEFGNNPNSTYHTFRHIDELGLDRNLVQNGIINDTRTIDNIPLNSPVNRIINVSGKRLQYTIYRRQIEGQDIFNVGRIHEIK